jgi:DNA-binding CsgD family transcriptional regulator
VTTTDHAEAAAVVITATCLPLASMTVPALPLRRALRQLSPELGAPRLTTDGSGPAPAEALDDWLDDTCRTRPVVLVVDDLHWADGATLDVLMYVLAAPADRRLAVMLTLRRGEVGTSEGLERWLADVRRMPVLTELRLGPLDRTETREHLTALMGSTPHESLVSDVHDRSGGNPYLGRLLVEDLPAGARHLPPDLPDDLRTAVTRPWHHLSPAARALVLAIAVGGEVAVGPAASRAVDITGTPTSEALALLREGVDAGILDVTPDGGHWFHHPLQAEALEARLSADERRLLHTAFAQACEADLPDLDGEPTAALLTAVSAVAGHHERADHPAEAYRWALRAADLAEALGDRRAALEHLKRLLVLHESAASVPGEHLGTRVALLDLMRRAAAGLGDHESEYRAVVALLAETSEEQDPLLAGELLVRREHLRFSTGRGFLRVEPFDHAVELTRSWPLSWQHAYALAELAHASLWADAPDAGHLAELALDRAEASGDDRALAYACAAASMATTFAHRAGGSGLGARGAEAAAAACDWWAFVHASLWEANGSETWGDAQWAGVVRSRREQLEDVGAPHPYVAWLSADEAGALLNAGDWRGCVDRLRVALGSDPGAGPDATTRLTAARLASLQGRQSEAEQHLARADELFAETTGFLAFEFDAARAVVRLGAADAEGAYEAALAGATSPGVPPTMCEWLCPLAARALADLADSAREQGASTTPALERLDAFVERFPHVIADSAFVSPTYRAQLDALDALYAAEVGRARRDTDVVQRWVLAANLLDGVCPWDAAYAAWRAAEAALRDRARPRDEGAGLLRRAQSLATELGAEPVLREVVALARSARVPLDEVRAVDGRPGVQVAAVGEGLGPLTTREREILEHVVAGRTYGEIAKALFVSEKTVSSHMSNLLRKTGAGNRVELATMARHAADRKRHLGTPSTTEPARPPAHP